MKGLGSLVLIVAAVAFFWTLGHAYFGARSDAAVCARGIVRVPVEEWRGGNAPPPRACP